MTIENMPTCMGNCCVSPSWAENFNKFNFTKKYITEKLGLDEQEKLVLVNLCKSWVLFSELASTPDDAAEFKDAIHRCQQIIALRVARRANPEIWTQP